MSKDALKQQIQDELDEGLHDALENHAAENVLETLFDKVDYLDQYEDEVEPIVLANMERTALEISDAVSSRYIADRLDRTDEYDDDSE